MKTILRTTCAILGTFAVIASVHADTSANTYSASASDLSALSVKIGTKTYSGDGATIFLLSHVKTMAETRKTAEDKRKFLEQFSAKLSKLAGIYETRGGKAGDMAKVLQAVEMGLKSEIASLSGSRSGKASNTTIITQTTGNAPIVQQGILSSMTTNKKILANAQELGDYMSSTEMIKWHWINIGDRKPLDVYIGGLNFKYPVETVAIDRILSDDHYKGSTLVFGNDKLSFYKGPDMSADFFESMIKYGSSRANASLVKTDGKYAIKVTEKSGTETVLGEQDLRTTNPQIADFLSNINSQGVEWGVYNIFADGKYFGYEGLLSTVVTRNDIIGGLNLFRADYGLGKLSFDEKIAQAADNHANYLRINIPSPKNADDADVFHKEEAGKVGFTGISPLDRITFAGYSSAKSAAEVIVTGENSANLIKDIVNLIHIPLHRTAFLWGWEEVGFCTESDLLKCHGVIDFSAKSELKKVPFIYPVNNAEIFEYNNVINEVPRPFPNNTGIMGLAMTILDYNEVGKKSVKLYDTTSGKEIPIIFSPYSSNDLVYFINTETLTGNHKYRIEYMNNPGSNCQVHTSYFYTGNKSSIPSSDEKPATSSCTDWSMSATSGQGLIGDIYINTATPAEGGTLEFYSMGDDSKKASYLLSLSQSDKDYVKSKMGNKQTMPDGSYVYSLPYVKIRLSNVEKKSIDSNGYTLFDANASIVR